MSEADEHSAEFTTGEPLLQNPFTDAAEDVSSQEEAEHYKKLSRLLCGHIIDGRTLILQAKQTAPGASLLEWRVEADAWLRETWYAGGLTEHVEPLKYVDGKLFQHPTTGDEDYG